MPQVDHESEYRFDGAVVMITGASRGLGKALATAFSRAGATVSLCARSPSSLESICAEITAAGGRCLARSVDVRDEQAVNAWVTETVEALGTPTVLINNASLLGPRSPLADFPLDSWREVLEVNLTGTLVVSRAVLRPMREARQGSIINVSSGAAIPPRKEWGAYAVSKDALEGLSINLASELEGSGVRVNIVDPGAMRTGMRAAAYPSEDPDTLKRPDTIGPLFLWLASDAAARVTGQRFQADDWMRQFG